MTFFEQIQEAALCDTTTLIINGCVLIAPVDRVTHPVERLLEDDLVHLGHNLAEFNEVLAANDQLLFFFQTALFTRYLNIEVLDVRNVTLRSYAKVILNAALGRKTVVVPSHWVRNVPTSHSLVPSQQILVCVGKNVTNM